MPASRAAVHATPESAAESSAADAILLDNDKALAPAQKKRARLEFQRAFILDLVTMIVLRTGSFPDFVFLCPVVEVDRLFPASVNDQAGDTLRVRMMEYSAIGRNQILVGAQLFKKLARSVRPAAVVGDLEGL